MQIPKSAVASVPVGTITGLPPPPDFWKVIVLAAVPVARIAGGFSLKVCPAETLNKIGLEIAEH